jgi:hypothetical protein
MHSQNKQDFIRQNAVENQSDLSGKKVYWSRHAITEAVKDNLTRQAVEAALANAELIEDYPATHRPLPDCLVLGFLPEKQPLHAVIAIDTTNERIFIITVYIPTKEKWTNDWRTRK